MPGEIHIWTRLQMLRTKAANRYKIEEEKCHIGHLLLEGLLHSPSHITQIDAVTDEKETNKSVATRSAQLASAMHNFGLKVGDCVVIMGYNDLNLVVPFYACNYNGYPLCAVDPSADVREIVSLFSCIRPKLVFCPKFKEEDIKEALRKNDLQERIVCFDDKNNNLETFVQTHKGTEVGFKEKFSGEIKTCMAMATIQWLSSLFYFVSGPLRHYTRVQSSAPLTPQLLVALINKYKPNSTAWTPHLLNQFLKASENVCDLSSFKYIAIGGSAIEKPLLDKFQQRCGAYLYLVYGMTELLAPVFDFVDETPFGSTGLPMKKFQYKIVGDEGKIVDKPFETGELWIKGDGFFKGYYNNPEETKRILTDDGWVMTGDIFYKDEKDFYYFVERKRLLIKYTGLWVLTVYTYFK
ncbi:luciferin 4-monooxygenase [Epargyreus clarus]|uniref:luciferin 4-monooxygenase n=1 Tax=Epargyreus clarus TaxID=520877 RepID=UPI003C2AE679